VNEKDVDESCKQRYPINEEEEEVESEEEQDVCLALPATFEAPAITRMENIIAQEDSLLSGDEDNGDLQVVP